MKIDNKGLDLIKKFEGFRSHPYRDSVGIWTVGYGTTHYMSGRSVTKDDQDLSKRTASMLLEDEVNKIYAHAVNVYVRVPLLQSHFDALVSLTYNIGPQAFKRSTLLKKLNEGDFEGAALEFPKWDKAGGRVSEGLLTRRMLEQDLFLL